MAIRSKLAICTSRIITDLQDNRISLIDVFEEIASPSFPVVIPRMSFLWVLEREGTDPIVSVGQVTLELNGQTLTTFPIDINFQDRNRMRCVAILGGMQISATGTLIVRFSGTGLPDAVYEIEIKSIVGGQPPVTDIALETHPAVMLSV